MKWIDSNRRILINLLLKHSNGGYSNMANSKSSWTNVVTEFNEETGLKYDKKVLITQCTTLKTNFVIFHSFANNSGFGIDVNGAVTGPPEAMNGYFISHSKALPFADKPLRFYDELLTLFGSKYHITVHKWYMKIEIN